MSLSDPTSKMSKSDDDANGCVRLLDDADSIQRKFKRAVTDSGTEIRFDPSRPAITNLLTIFQLLTGKTRKQVETHFADKGYAQLKQDLAEATVEFLSPFQERVRGIDDEELTAILKSGAAKAQRIAVATLETAKEKMGISGFRKSSGQLASEPDGIGVGT